MLKTKEKKEPPNYEEIISTLTSELESLRHQLAVKTHNQLLLKLQDKENQQQTSNKTDKKIKEITTHFQEEIKLTKEIIDSQNILNFLNSKLNDKQFALYKLQTTKEETTTKINIPNKIKETNSQISKLKEQINTQNQILNEKKRFYMELYKKREIFETYLGIKNNNTNNNNNSNLFYLYNRFVYEINNLNNEYSRRHKMNLVNQSNMKIQNLLEQLTIRDEYIDKYNKELLQKKVKLDYPQDKEIKNIKDVYIEKIINVPPQSSIPLLNVANKEQQGVDIKSITKEESLLSKKDAIILPKSERSKSNIAKTIQDKPVVILPQVQQNISAFQSPYNTNTSNFLLNNTNNQGKINYSGYSNPNIIKKKQVFKTKTNEIIQKAKNNELSELRLNILNGMYSASKVMYVHKNEKDSLDKSEDYVISFDAKLLNKSQSDASIYSNISEKEVSKNGSTVNLFKRGTPSRLFLNGSNNINERQIDSKIKRLLGGKTRYGPYIKK